MQGQGTRVLRTEQVYQGDWRTKARRYRRMLVLVTWLGLMGGASFMALVWKIPVTSFTIKLFVIQVLGMLLFGTVFSSVFFRYDRQAQLILSHEGLRSEGCSRHTPALIPWETIAEIRPVTILGLPFLKLIFQDGRPPVLINCMALPLTAKRLVEEIATFRKAL